jgi:hypothetical protein
VRDAKSMSSGTVHAVPLRPFTLPSHLCRTQCQYSRDSSKSCLVTSQQGVGELREVGPALLGVAAGWHARTLHAARLYCTEFLVCSWDVCLAVCRFEEGPEGKKRRPCRRQVRCPVC